MDRDAGTLGRKLQGDGSPDAARRTCHQYHLIAHLAMFAHDPLRPGSEQRPGGRNQLFQVFSHGILRARLQCKITEPKPELYVYRL